MEDRSLDEFLDDGGEPESEPDESSEEPDQARSPGTEASAPEDPDPATARWTPDGEACASCGETVTRLWLDGGQRVCRDCKNW